MNVLKVSENFRTDYKIRMVKGTSETTWRINSFRKPFQIARSLSHIFLFLKYINFSELRVLMIHSKFHVNGKVVNQAADACKSGYRTLLEDMLHQPKKKKKNSQNATLVTNP